MKKILAFALLLTFSNAQAQKIPFDFVTYDTVRQFVKEHPVEYDTWLRVYIYKVKAGAGITHPRKGVIYSNTDDTQNLANMLSFYASIREKDGQTLRTVTDKFMVFDFEKRIPKIPPTIGYPRRQR